ncbi:methionine ABC transporter substrate-binding protein [Ornithinimicrobium sp. Arc0846-15]|nr:methionine ABC transporter substrate-binding protein [Ornithinimicrobium laminariae]
MAMLAACGGTADESAAEGTADNPVTVGVVGASDPYWSTFTDAAADEGISVEIVDFADYNQPNPALSEGEIDLNQFQHIVYLAEYNVTAEQDLQPIGSTAIYPLPLYSTQYDSVDAIPDGAEIAIPSDPSNRARALLVLQSAGLISLNDGGSPYSTPADIIAADSKVEVTELDPALVATSLPDVAGGIINNDFADKAGLTADDILASDDPTDPAAQGYINVWASNAEDVDNETYLKLVDLYQSNEEVQAGVVDNSGGTAVMLTTPVEELVDSLAQTEADSSAQG